MIRGDTVDGPMAAPVCVAIGQQPALALDILSQVLVGAGLTICSAETSVFRLGRAIAAHRPDVLLVDSSLDPDEPLGFVAPLRAAAPGVPVVVIVDVLSPMLANAVLSAEVDGIVPGDSTAAELIRVLERVAAGASVYPAGWLGTAHRAERESLSVLLSARQLDVLADLAAGLDNAQIAAQLHISPNTVKFHVRAIYQRLGVSNRVQAARRLADERPDRAPGEFMTVAPPMRVGRHRLDDLRQTTRKPVSGTLPRA